MKSKGVLPSPLWGGPGWGCFRQSFIGSRSHPHLQLLPTRGRRVRTALFLALFVLFFPFAALAQTFPPLTGRVVDQANLLKPEERAALDAKLKMHEDKTSDQVVVATVSSLEGTSIEDYANRLFRHWQLGQKKTNNGALLLVAPNERKVRIEVGYGLEGALTDALSKVIITTAIAPQFQKGNFAGGIDAGIDAVLSILTGDAEEWQRRAEIREDADPIVATMATFIFFLFILFVVLLIVFSNTNSRGIRRTRSGSWITTSSSNNRWGSGGSSWSSGSGGFSGGGGSSGGGGASGSW